MHKKISKSGSSLIAVLIIIGITAVLATTIPIIVKSSEQQLKIVKTRSTMQKVEIKLRSVLSHPSTFSGCTTVGGVASCNISTAALRGLLTVPVPGTACNLPSSNCGVELLNNNKLNISSGASVTGSINPSLHAYEFQFYLRYTINKDISVKDTLISIPVSYDLMQASQFDCASINPNLPKFEGIDGNGNVICSKLNDDCPAGQYLVSVNQSTLIQTCQPIPVSNINCGTNSLIGAFAWNPSSIISHNCIPRLNPFDVFTTP